MTGYDTHRGPSGRRWALTVAVVSTSLGLVLGAVAVVGNDFAVRIERVSIPTATGHLDGVLAWPESVDEPVGVVAFVHGDGPADATGDGFYVLIWESLASAGYASLSWSKPGVGDSSGDWLDQSMQDRADEVGEALDWVAAHPGIDPRRIGLWGASQAGWVVPSVAAEREDVSFVILVSPAVNWLRQGRYNLLAELDEKKASDSERQHAVEVSDNTRSLLDRRATYDEYREETIDPAPLDEQRWGFVLENYTADATDDLRAMGKAGVPTLLLLADDDLNVDVGETERIYRETLGPNLQVQRFPDARHSLARTAVEDSALWGTLVAVFAPRQVFVPGALEAHHDFLTSRRGRGPARTPPGRAT